jgi:hypothetical protein
VVLASLTIFGGVYRPVHLRPEVGTWTLITALTVITPYSTVQITISQKLRYQTVQDGATVQYDFDRILAVCSNFGTTHFFSFYKCL